MILNAYTIYDSKALSYSPPFFANAHGQAVRDVSDAANDPSNNLGRHPADFTVYCVGSFDTSSGQLLLREVREHISDVLPLVRVREQQDFFRQPAAAGDGEAAKANGSAS